MEDGLPTLKDGYIEILEEELRYLIVDSKNKRIGKELFLKLWSELYDYLNQN